MISVADLESAMRLPSKEWEGQCFAVATSSAELLGPGYTAVYGHYLGPINPEGFWAHRINSEIVQHGWVITPDGGVLDPTRWSFEAIEPYIFESNDHNHQYDEGGNMWRSKFSRPPPRHDPNKKNKTLTLSNECVCKLVCMLGPNEVIHIQSGLVLTVEQLMWLSNVPYNDLAPFNSEVYSAIGAVKLGAFIPIDNRRRAQRAPEMVRRCGDNRET